MNFHRPKICRICRAPDNDDLISVRLIQESISIARMVEVLTDIQVTLDKNLPQNICLQCLERVRSAYQLRLQCIESDKQFRNEIYSVKDVLKLSHDESKDMIKLEIEALDKEIEQEDECEGVQEIFTTDPDEHSLSIVPEELNEKVDLKIIAEENEESFLVEESIVETEDSKLTAAQQLIDILAPEEDNNRKSSLMYLSHYQEKDYEVLIESDHYDHVRFMSASCCGCSERFKDKTDLVQHGLIEHRRLTKDFRENDLQECPICFETFSTVDDLTLHRSHIDTDRFHCRECDILMDSREQLFYHLDTTHSIIIDSFDTDQDHSEEEFEEIITSDQVSGATLSSFNKNQYRLIATDKEYDLVEFMCLRCCGCESLFEYREQFETHSKERHLPERVEHDEQNPYECSICYERFAKKSSLTFHRNKPNKRRVVCRLCEEIFKGETSWRRHLIKYHSITPHMNDDVGAEIMEVDECDMQTDDCKSDAYSIQEIEYIEEDQTDEQEFEDDEAKPTPNDDEEKQETIQIRQDSKYITTRQRKQMALIPGNFVQIVAEYEGYNIVEITKERCCFCLKFFDSLEQLNEHSKEHQTKSLSEQPPPSKNRISYECEYCLKKFDIAMIFVVHKRIREQKQFYQCRLCDFVIDSESRLKNHMLYNEQHARFFNIIREDVSDRYDAVKLPGFRCCGCECYFEDESALTEHSRKEHRTDSKKDADKRRPVCVICDRQFNTTMEMTNHQKRRDSTIRYYCKLCDFESLSEARMLKHLYSSIHNESLPAIEVQKVEVGARRVGSVRYCCFDECALPFHNFGKLLQHVLQTHQSKREANKAAAVVEGESSTNRWQCDCCCQLFRTGTILRQHQFAHRVPKTFVCSICGEAKPSKTALTVHEMKHTGERPHACNICNKRFTSKTILNSHMKCHFPKQHQCPDCGEKFARGENLKRHIRHRHSEATYSCTFCPRMLKTREAQILHERSHTGEKPFECRTDGCSKRYSSITDRRRHEMASHTGERPHQCSYCAASFVRKRQLTIHERKHTGERPFACDQCGKGFIDAPLLKKHVCC